MTPTAEEVNAERGRANAFFVGLGFLSPSPSAVTAFATALAVRAKEAYQMGLADALGVTEGSDGNWDSIVAAISALMEPGT